MTTLMFASRDGSYGDADGLVLLDATGFTAEDYEIIGTEPRFTAEVALEAAEQHGNERIVFAWLTDNEADQVLESLTAAVEVLLAHGAPGLAEQIGDVIDVFTRSGITLP